MKNCRVAYHKLNLHVMDDMNVNSKMPTRSRCIHKKAKRRLARRCLPSIAACRRYGFTAPSASRNSNRPASGILEVHIVRL